jgi:hypothetical protein
MIQDLPAMVRLGRYLIALTISCSLFTLGMMSQQMEPPARRHVEASSYELIDDNGNPIAVLRSRDGLPLLEFLDKGGQVVTTLRVLKDGSAFQLQQGDRIAVLEVTRDEARVVLRGSDSSTVLSQTAKGSAWTLSDAAGKPRVRLDAGDEGGHLRFHDDAGRQRLTLGVDPEGTPSIRIIDDKGQCVREIK